MTGTAGYGKGYGKGYRLQERTMRRDFTVNTSIDRLRLSSDSLARLWALSLVVQFNDRKRTATLRPSSVASFAVLPDCLLRLLLRLAFYCLIVSKKRREDKKRLWVLTL